MNENKVSEGRIRELIENSEKNVTTIFDKVTVVSLKLPNGFVITESSGCVDPENYDEKTGELICMGKIEDRLWELEGYLLQNKLCITESSGCVDPEKLCEEASEKDIDKFKVKVEPGESPFDCLGREFFSLARDKFKIHGYDDPDKFYAFKVIGKLHMVKHGDNLILLETGDIRETLINISRRKKFVINTGSTEVETQEFDIVEFNKVFQKKEKRYEEKYRESPAKVILNPSILFYICSDKDFLPGFKRKYLGIEVEFSRAIEDLYDMIFI